METGFEEVKPVHSRHLDMRDELGRERESNSSLVSVITANPYKSRHNK